MKCSALRAEINIVSSSYNFNIIKLHSRVKSLSALRYFPISFILNRIFLKHSPEIFSYLTVLEYSPLAEVLITMYCNISILVLSNFYLQQF
jgi:hypothetical protein